MIKRFWKVLTAVGGLNMAVSLLALVIAYKANLIALQSTKIALFELRKNELNPPMTFLEQFLNRPHATMLGVSFRETFFLHHRAIVRELGHGYSEKFDALALDAATFLEPGRGPKKSPLGAARALNTVYPGDLLPWADRKGEPLVAKGECIPPYDQVYCALFLKKVNAMILEGNALLEKLDRKLNEAREGLR